MYLVIFAAPACFLLEITITFSMESVKQPDFGDYAVFSFHRIHKYQKAPSI